MAQRQRNASAGSKKPTKAKCRTKFGSPVSGELAEHNGIAFDDHRLRARPGGGGATISSCRPKSTSRHVLSNGDSPFCEDASARAGFAPARRSRSRGSLVLRLSTMGSARANEAILVGLGSPSSELVVGRLDRMRRHCRAPDRSVLSPTERPRQSAAPTTPRSDAGSRQTTAIVVVRGR